jgi:hypothetical protein
MEWKNILDNLKYIEEEEVQSNPEKKSNLEKKVLSMFVGLLVQKTLTDKELHDYSFSVKYVDIATSLGLSYDSSQPKYDILAIAESCGLIDSEE